MSFCSFGGFVHLVGYLRFQDYTFTWEQNTCKSQESLCDNWNKVLYYLIHETTATPQLIGHPYSCE